MGQQHASGENSRDPQSSACNEELHKTFVSHIINKRLLPWVRLLWARCFLPFCLRHCLFSACTLTERRLCLARRDGRVCVRVCLSGCSRLTTARFLSVCNASEWELRAACSVVWSWGGGLVVVVVGGATEGGRGRGDWSGVEERQREKRDLCAQGTLQGQPSTSVEWGTAVHWLHNVHGIRGRRSTPTPAARLSKVARRSSREHINSQRHTENNRGAIYRAEYHLDFFYVQTEVIKQ